MIYEFPDANAPIRQGDIFEGVPRIEVSLRRIPLLDEDNQQRVVSWNDIAHAGKPVTAVVAIRSVAAIVATQDCDTLHAPDITLCQDQPEMVLFAPRQPHRFHGQNGRQLPGYPARGSNGPRGTAHPTAGSTQQLGG